MHGRYTSECVNEESMSVSQRILKREVSYRHVRGKGETSVELLEEISNNQNMNQAYKRVYRKVF